MRRIRVTVLAVRIGLSVRQTQYLCAQGKLPPPYKATKPHATGKWIITEDETITVKKP